MIVIIDELGDLLFQIARQIIIFQQDAVLECLMPSLNLPLGLGMIRCASDMVHALIFQIVRKVFSDI